MADLRKLARRVRSVAVSALLAVAALYTAACSGNSAANVATMQVPPDAMVVTEGMLAEAKKTEKLTEFQAELLSDGLLTLADYDNAYAQLVGCMRNAGWELSRELPPTLSRGHSFRAFHRVGGEEARAAAEACRVEYVGIINLLWTQEHRFSETELQAARDALAMCLGAQGVTFEFSPHPSTAEFSAYLAGPEHLGRPQPFSVCQLQIEEAHGIPNFGG